MPRRRLIILGSTGSIGRQTLDVIRRQRNDFEIVGLSANANSELIKQQAEEFGVRDIFIEKEKTSKKTLAELVEGISADRVVVAVSGMSGLDPTLAAIRSGKSVALANKETLVADGDHVMGEAKKNRIPIIPIDSEMSAIFQLIAKFKPEKIKKIIITSSGGPFWKSSSKDIDSVTPEQALRHPVWDMGKKISIDSATWVNKGFEVIEAHHFFGMPYEKIKVLVHPMGRVHGLVELEDGTRWQQKGPADMRFPIHYALYWPDERASNFRGIGLSGEIGISKVKEGDDEFYPPEHSVLEGLRLGYEVGRRGGRAGAIFVKANDEAVQDFLDGKIKFLEIYERIKSALHCAKSAL